jgi:Protein of unknown function (DUF3237)
MQFRNDGLTLSFDAETAPGPEGMTVTVQPRSASNVVLVHYCVNGDGAKTIRAHEIPGSRLADRQSFRVTFPRLPVGALVEYLPVCQNAGRQVPPPAVRDLPASFRVPESAPDAPATPAVSEARSIQRHPFDLEHLTTFSVFLREPEIIGQTPEGLRVNWWLKSGSFDGPRLRGIVRPEGADWMTIRQDGIGIMEVRATIETHDGALIISSYSGLFDLGEDGYENFLVGKYPKAPEARTVPRYLTADPRYKWLNRLQCMGAGAVDMDKLNVVYDLYALR